MEGESSGNVEQRSGGSGGSVTLTSCRVNPIPILAWVIGLLSWRSSGEHPPDQDESPGPKTSGFEGAPIAEPLGEVRVTCAHSEPRLSVAFAC